MNWLKGLVAPAAQYVGQAVQQQGGQPGMPPQDPNAPPMGGAPNQYGFQQQPMQPMQQQPPMQQQAPMGGGGMGGLPDASQWSTGTRTQGGAQQQQGGGIAGGGGISGGGSISGNTASSGGKSLEARCAELEHDVASLALFSRTLLTMLEEQKVVTREQFMETKNKLDMLDGKIDDR